MPKVVDESRSLRHGIHRVYIFCPGCKADYPEIPEYDGLHCLNVTEVHKFNGDYERPTFEPSLMAPRAVGTVCHSYIRDGMIQFLDDCTHPLRGQTVPLLDVPDQYLPNASKIAIPAIDDNAP